MDDKFDEFVSVLNPIESRKYTRGRMSNTEYWLKLA